MPTKKWRLTRTEAQEHRTRLLQLEKMGIPVCRGGDFWHELNGIALDQIDYEFARVYELPLGDLAVVLSAELTVRTSRVLITDREMTTPWDDCLLDLSDPKGSPYYEDLAARLPETPRFLNRWFTRNIPPPLRQEEGVIIAYGRSRIPSECHDGTQIPIRLVLMDQWCNELCFEFEARVDRSVKRKYEPLLKGRDARARLELRRALRRKSHQAARDQWYP